MRILSMTAQKVDSTGSGVFLTELVRCFHKAGHQQAVIFGRVEEDTIRLPEGVKLYPVMYESEEVPFCVCGMSDEMPYDSTRYRDMTDEMTHQLFDAFRKRIRQAVEEFQPDVVLCHHLYFLAALVRQMYPRLPVFGQCHGSDLRQFRKNTWQHELIRTQIPRLSGIFALHQEQKQTICQTFGVPESLVRVHGVGYNSGVFFTDEQIKGEKNPHQIRLVFAGKLSEKKGVFSLIRALDHLAQPENYSLALAGGYSTLEELEAIRRCAEAAPCTVELLGRLDQATLARELNRSDVFVLPSFYEGLPLVLMEAMACGLRVICTDLPGIRPWLDRAIPGNGAEFVAPPEMRNEDEPVPESLPDFEERLARAVEAVVQRPLPDMALVEAVSWEGLGRKYASILMEK